MSKMETLIEIQNLIQNFKNESALLKTHTKTLLNSIDKNEFIENQISQDTTANLITINQIQKECKKQYLTFMECEVFPKSIKEVQDALNDKKLEMAFIGKYKMALETFCSFHSKDEKYEAVLVEEKQNINIEELDEMSESEAAERFGKYLEFVEAYNAIEPLELVRYVQKLTPYFDAELITAAIFNKNLSMTTQLIDNSENEGKQSIDDEIHLINLVEVEDNVVEISESDDLIEIEDTVEISELDDLEVKEIDIKISKTNDYLTSLCKIIDKKYSISASNNKNEKKTFGYKAFKSDINGFFGKLRIAILKNIFIYDCATCDLLQNIINGDSNFDSEVIEKECNYLINKGYIKRYVTNALPDLYYLTARGLKAFSSKSSAAYLHLRLPKKKDEIMVNNAVNFVCYLLKTYAVVQVTKSANKLIGNISCSESILGNSFVLQNTNEKDECFIYITIFDSDLELIEEYIGKLKKCLKKQEMKPKIFILGYDATHIQNISNLLNEYISEYQIDTYELLNNSWSESVVEVLESNSESSKENEIDESNEIEDESVPELLSQPMADGLIQKDESVTQAIICEKQKVASTSIEQELSINSKVPDDNMKEKSCKSIEEMASAYQKMICTDKIYCATAYLKAASLSDPNMIPFYNKLAYAVNDPLECCSYSSDKLISIFFDESTVLNDCLTVAAVLRNYASNHIHFDYNIQQLQSIINNNNTILDDKGPIEYKSITDAL